MSEVKWTLGPWYFGVKEVLKGGKCIAEVWRFDVGKDEAMANGYLIAAAPDLYDLVADAVEDPCENESDWNKAARAALSKARGEREGRT